MIRGKSLMLGIVLVGSYFIAASPAFAENMAESSSLPSISITVLPDPVLLEPNMRTRAEVNLQNNSAEFLYDVHLDPITNEYVDMAFNPSAQTLYPYGELLFEIFVSGKTGRDIDMQVPIKISYQWIPPGFEKPVFRSFISSFNVKTVAFEDVESMLDVDVQISSDTFTEVNPGDIMVMIRNKSNHAVTIRDPSLEWGLQNVNPTLVWRPGTGHIHEREPYPKTWTWTMLLHPGDAGTFIYMLTVDDRVRPGKDKVIVQFNVEWGDNENTYVGTYITTVEANVAVFGESDILTVLALPAVWLIPGIVFIVTAGFFWKNFKKWGGSAGWPESLEFKKPEFWIVSITSSWIIIYFYPMLSGLFGEKRFLIGEYGLIDIIFAWCIGLVLGLIVWVLGQLFQLLMARPKRPRHHNLPSSGHLPNK